MKEIITFDVFIDDEEMTGVDKISIVRSPAIAQDFIYMNDEQIEEYKQIILEEEKRIISGPALIPNLSIIRKDENTGEPYYIEYSSEQIESIVQKFFKLKDQFSINKNHKTDLSNIWIYESWIVGDNDKSKNLGFDVPKGTWMVTLKVEDDEIWNGIKSGKYRGFSIEGLFKFKRKNKVVKQKKWKRNDITSSNVDKVMFNDETNELVVGFNDGSRYTYFDIDKNEFFSVIDGLAECKTSGENKWGSWEVGKTPSVGAAVWKYLIDTGKIYKEGGVFQEENSIELMKVSFDYDGTLSTKDGRDMAKKLINDGDDIWIISARDSKEGMIEVADELGIPLSRVIVAGSNDDKIKKIEELGIEKHYDNNPDVIKELGNIGVKFSSVEKNDSNYNIDNKDVVVELEKPKSGETENEFISRCMGSDKMNSEYPDETQRAAVCYAYWDEKQEKINNNMVNAILTDGTTIYTDADMFNVGGEVYFMDGETKTPAPTGEYEIDGGSILVVENGVITEIKEVTAASEETTINEEVQKEETKMEMDPMLMEQFDALKMMIGDLSSKIDSLIGSETEDMSKVKQSIEGLEVKLEKISIEKEMKSIETTDSLKKVAQSKNEKARLDYDVMVKLNKKF